MFDLVIRGGTVVTPSGSIICDVGVRGEAIVELGNLSASEREIDARGKLVVPGGIDVHVHFTPTFEPGPGVPMRPDDFETGSLAAVAGGITTIGNMTHQRQGQTLREAIERDMAIARKDSVVDYVLHPVLNEPSPLALADISELAREGHTSLRLFMSFQQFDRHVDQYVDALRIAGRSGVLTMIHCEDGAMIRHLVRELVRQGRRAMRHYPDTRPPSTEIAAVERAIAFARATGAAVYLVHVSSAEAVEAVRRGRQHGARVYVETRPLYLYLTRQRFKEADAGKYVGNPPLREAADVEAIWEALASEEIQTVCSDHAPWTLDQKLDPALDVSTALPGVADLETLMPMLFSEGVVARRISLERFVELTSTNAAKLFGMFPRKGAVAVGADADLVVWDPQMRREVNGSAMLSRAGYSVYDGWIVQGWPSVTVSRGEVVFQNGELQTLPGRGRWVHCDPAPGC